MQRHVMRLGFLMVSCIFAFAWLIWKCRNPLTPDQYATEFFTACAALLAVVLVLVWATWVDFRTQGLWPRGVIWTDHRDRIVALDSSLAHATLLRACVPTTAREMWESRHPGPSLPAARMLGVLAIFISVAAASRFLLPPAWRFWGWLLGFFFFAFAILLLLRRTMTLAAVRWSTEAAAFGICGACASDMRGLDPQDDGCTVCQSCGAAWRIEILPQTAVSQNA